MELPDREVHFWACPLEAARAVAARIGQCACPEADEPERERAARFRRPEDADRFLAARAFVKAVLSRYTGTSPDRVTLTPGVNGKPTLADGQQPADVTFNLSHSRARVAVVVARAMPVGVDIEDMDPRLDVASLARFALSPREHGQLMALAAQARIDFFLRAWVRKEAVLKASGTGLLVEPSRIEVPFPAGTDCAAAVACELRGNRVFGVREVAGTPGHFAAVAAPGMTWALRNFAAPSALPAGCR